MASQKRVKWLMKKAHKRKVRKTRKKMTFQAKLLSVAKTVKVKKDENGRYLGSIEQTPQEAANRINLAFKAGFPIKAYERVYLPTIWGVPYEEKLVGYYVTAEVTDIGELWVKFAKNEDVQPLHLRLYEKEQEKNGNDSIALQRPWNKP